MTINSFLQLDKWSLLILMVIYYTFHTPQDLGKHLNGWCFLAYKGDLNFHS